MRALGGFFYERGGINVAYEHGVVDGLDTTVGERFWGGGGW